MARIRCVLHRFWPMLALCAAPAAAQTAPRTPATAIIADSAASGRGLGTVVGTAGRVTVIEGGTLAGTNLFHSFATFDLAAGDTARWTSTLTDPARITAVINRVTGGTISAINGRIDTQGLPHAAFFFINPAGIVLGEGARVDVPGAAHFSTAAALRFRDGGSFSLSTPGGSTLSMAAPSGFGFLGSQRGIIVKAQARTLGTGGLDLAARNITFADATFATPWLRAVAVGTGLHETALGDAPSGDPQGRLTFRSSRIGVGSAGAQLAAGTIDLFGSALKMQTAKAAPTGDIALVGQRITLGSSTITSTGTTSSGAIRLEGGSLDLYDAALVTRAPRGASGAIAVTARTLALDAVSILSETGGAGRAGAITLTVSGKANVRDSIVSSTARSRSTGAAGAVSLRTGAMEIYASRISSDVQRAALGSAGAVTVDAASLRFDGGAQIASTTLGRGGGGALAVQVDGTLELYSQSAISADTQAAGAGGDVHISANRIVVDDALISADGYAAGQAGAVTVDAARLVIANGGAISSDTRGAGSGGSVVVNAGRMVVDSAFVSADSYARGRGGTITVNAQELRLGSEAKIRSAAYGRGAAGSVTVVAPQLVLRGNSSINSDALDRGSAGEVRVTGHRIIVSGNSYVTSDGVSEGGGGAVTVRAGRLALVSGGFLAADTYQDGASGAVSVDAGTLLLDSGYIATQARPASSGDAGTIRIRAGRITARNSSFIASGTFGDGSGGGLDIAADRIAVLDSSFFGTDSNGAGKAGTIKVTAGRLALIGGGTISSNAFAEGNGGDIAVAAQTLILREGVIATSADPGAQGNGGDIAVRAGRLILTHGVISSDNMGRGAAGTIAIRARSFALDGGAVSTFAGAAARNAGAITMNVTGALALGGGAAITASSANARPSGTISITTSSVAAFGSATAITTSNIWRRPSAGAAPDSGGAGTIMLGAERITFADGAVLASNSLEGPAGDIAVTMPATGIFSLIGAGDPGVVTTSSGPGTGGRITISNPLALVSNGGSILAQGQLGGALLALDSRFFIQSADRANRIAVDGAIRIDSSFYDVSAGTSPPLVDFLDASKVLLGQCASARATGEASRIGWRNTGPYAAVSRPSPAPCPAP
ncbi:filamentous hemagglutinin N-terminal domain-containing protein [Novosphingobium sp. PASSN1]|uniref:two-partner secretion domain-containing protein n=1 Tax=Novosphingobium sp. PASSN1 TaxID=2015561 RepID=UPI000BDC19DF|nr:filamentous hemagglutinin N-terminal domain-containing protein [Novosphingobium sp. PASSN1]OYU35663.1 MAG: hypothetical protein CFE35_09160 [Novosphingobium sp. PASSN1]